MGLFDFLNPFRQEKPNPLVHPPSRPPVPADARRELLALQSKVGLLEEKLKLAETRFLQLVRENNDLKARNDDQVAGLMIEREKLEARLSAAQAELASLGKFASIKSESRKVVYGVSPELRKKWLSIDDSVDRHQVVSMLGQPSMILISEDFDLRQAVQGGLQGADDAAAAKIVGQVDRVLARTRCFDTKFLEQGRFRVLSVWVYANDTIEPGFVIFASESDGGAMIRCFPPEC